MGHRDLATTQRYADYAPNEREVEMVDRAFASELEPHLNAVMAAVRAPDHREPDGWPYRERFFKVDAGPSRWLMVVVDFENEPARIVTALGYRHGRSPDGWTP